MQRGKGVRRTGGRTIRSEGDIMRISRAGALAGTLFLALPAAAQTAAGPVSEPPASAATDGDPNARRTINLLQDGLSLPTVWRTNLAVDHRLFWGIVATGEFGRTPKVEQSVGTQTKVTQP